MHGAAPRCGRSWSGACPSRRCCATPTTPGRSSAPLLRQHPFDERLAVLVLHLDGRVALAGGELRVDGRLGVGLALVLLGHRLERRAHLLRVHVMATHASRALRELGRGLRHSGAEREHGGCGDDAGFHVSSCLGRGAAFHSWGAVCARPLWQSMQVAFPSSTCVCIGRTNSFCFSRIAGLNSWQWRQARESLPLYSSQTCFAIRRRSFLKRSSVAITPRISPSVSLAPATALYQRTCGYE